MVLKGRYSKGVIVFDQPVSLPEGTVVEVATPDHAETDSPPVEHDGLLPEWDPYIGIVTDAPADLAEQHDHYVHGTPKR